MIKCPSIICWNFHTYKYDMGNHGPYQFILISLFFFIYSLIHFIYLVIYTYILDWSYDDEDYEDITDMFTSLVISKNFKALIWIQRQISILYWICSILCARLLLYSNSLLIWQAVGVNFTIKYNEKFQEHLKLYLYF